MGEQAGLKQARRDARAGRPRATMKAHSGLVPWQGTDGAPVALSGGRDGQLLYHAGFPEVQTTMGGCLVRVIASDADLAVRFGRTLRAWH